MTSQPEYDQHTDDQYHDHMRRIADIIAQWRKDEIGTVRKRKLIADENKAYYRGDFKSPVTGESLTKPSRGPNPVPMLAEAAGVPEEAMSAALGVRRRANWEAAHNDDAPLDELREIIASGLRGYHDILKAGGHTP